ncbi:hypothetical protein EDD11_000493 [Mortierella claussenii]|nr:hypothetical protein EDD11_000493 [Mortierella claussenii]
MLAHNKMHNNTSQEYIHLHAPLSPPPTQPYPRRYDQQDFAWAKETTAVDTKKYGHSPVQEYTVNRTTKAEDARNLSLSVVQMQYQNQQSRFQYDQKHQQHSQSRTRYHLDHKRHEQRQARHARSMSSLRSASAYPTIVNMVSSTSSSSSSSRSPPYPPFIANLSSSSFYRSSSPIPSNASCCSSTSLQSRNVSMSPEREPEELHHPYRRHYYKHNQHSQCLNPDLHRRRSLPFSRMTVSDIDHDNSNKNSNGDDVMDVDHRKEYLCEELSSSTNSMMAMDQCEPQWRSSSRTSSFSSSQSATTSSPSPVMSFTPHHYHSQQHQRQHQQQLHHVTRSGPLKRHSSSCTFPSTTSMPSMSSSALLLQDLPPPQPQPQPHKQLEQRRSSWHRERDRNLPHHRQQAFFYPDRDVHHQTRRTSPSSSPSLISISEKRLLDTYPTPKLKTTSLLSFAVTDDTEPRSSQHTCSLSSLPNTLERARTMLSTFKQPSAPLKVVDNDTIYIDRAHHGDQSNHRNSNIDGGAGLSKLLQQQRSSPQTPPFMHLPPPQQQEGSHETLRHYPRCPQELEHENEQSENRPGQEHDSEREKEGDWAREIVDHPQKHTIILPPLSKNFEHMSEAQRILYERHPPSPNSDRILSPSSSPTCASGSGSTSSSPSAISLKSQLASAPASPSQPAASTAFGSTTLPTRSASFEMDRLSTFGAGLPPSISQYSASAIGSSGSVEDDHKYRLPQLRRSHPLQSQSRPLSWQGPLSKHGSPVLLPSLSSLTVPPRQPSLQNQHQHQDFEIPSSPSSYRSSSSPGFSPPPSNRNNNNNNNNNNNSNNSNNDSATHGTNETASKSSCRLNLPETEGLTVIRNDEGTIMVYNPLLDNMTFRCALCPGESFGRIHDLKRHQTSKHQEMTWPCDFCHRPFVRRDALLRHYTVKAARDDGLHPASHEVEKLLAARARAKMLY